jgi:hypothetical protein
MIGQVLYLEAEAHGVRVTGIGCFFDDPVHELMGLTDDAFQSLYRFTIGGPREDARLATRAVYHHLEAPARERLAADVARQPPELQLPSAHEQPVFTVRTKAAHSVECAALSFLRLCLRTDGVDGLWARPLEHLFL